MLRDHGKLIPTPRGRLQGFLPHFAASQVCPKKGPKHAGHAHPDQEICQGAACAAVGMALMTHRTTDEFGHSKLCRPKWRCTFLAIVGVHLSPSLNVSKHSGRPKSRKTTATQGAIFLFYSTSAQLVSLESPVFEPPCAPSERSPQEIPASAKA